MATFTKFQPFVENLAEKLFNLGSDTLKVALTNSDPLNTSDQLADVTQIAGTFGYTTGGTAASISSSAQSGGTYKLVLADVTFTASGGSIGPLRYAVLYDDTATGDELIGYWDYGTNLTITDGNSLLVDFSASNGVLQIV